MVAHRDDKGVAGIKRKGKKLFQNVVCVLEHSMHVPIIRVSGSLTSEDGEAFVVKLAILKSF